jgi:hypothetical protein
MVTMGRMSPFSGSERADLAASERDGQYFVAVGDKSVVRKICIGLVEAVPICSLLYREAAPRVDGPPPQLLVVLSSARAF